MTTGGGFFRSILSVEDMSSQVIGRITQKMNVLNTATEQVAARLQRVASAQLGAATAAQEGGKATEFQIKSAQKLGESLDKLSQQGIITSSGLRRMAQQATLLARVTGSGGLAGSLRLTRRELELLAPSLQRAEETATAAGIKFQFMGDVSQTTSFRMRQLSASAQGAMLGMSLLQGNVIGLAFSLIFLQFSGFLKLSLAVAGATAILIPFITKFKSLLDERRRTQDLANTLFILTGNMKGFDLFAASAERLALRLGLTGEPARDLARAVAEASVELRKFNEEPTPERLEAFITQFLIASAEGKNFEEAMQAALEVLKPGEEGFHDLAEAARELGISLQDLRTRGARAIFELAKNNEISVSSIIDAYSRLGVGIPDSVLEALRKSKDGFLSLEEAFGEGFGNLTDIQQAELGRMLLDQSFFFVTQESEYDKAVRRVKRFASSSLDALATVGRFLKKEALLWLSDQIVFFGRLGTVIKDFGIKFTNSILKIWNATKDVRDAITSAAIWTGQFFSELGRLTGSGVLAGIRAIANAFQAVWEKIKQAWNWAGKFLGLFNPVGERIAKNMGLVSSAFATIGSEIRDVNSLALTTLATLGKFASVEANISPSLGTGMVASLATTAGGALVASSSININVNVHDNNVGSEDDARKLGAVISSEILKGISQGNIIGFHPSVV